MTEEVLLEQMHDLTTDRLGRVHTSQVFKTRSVLRTAGWGPTAMDLDNQIAVSECRSLAYMYVS